MMTRREALKTAALATAAVATTTGVLAQLSNVDAAHVGVYSITPAQGAAPTGPFTLPPLPYAFDALEPHIDARMMEIHHDKHHATYVANLNKAMAEVPE